jgi:hypothetical protein
VAGLIAGVSKAAQPTWASGVRQRGLLEFLPEAPIEQTLSFVTAGPPTPAMNDVIQAARRAAEKVM